MRNQRDGAAGNVTEPMMIQNTKARDNGARLIFDDPILCAEFLRGYVGIDLLKNVQPEDIEDISDKFFPLWQEGRESDSVKRIRLPDKELYLIAIVEHQSRVYYDMPFKLLRYIVLVLTDYEREQEKLQKGITKTKDFKYPPILPIVYYEGTERWTAVRSFHERTALSDVLGRYIPDFEYLVVPIVNYSDQEIIEKEDELSLIMLVNKLKSTADFEKLKNIPPEYFEKLSEKTPEYLLKLIGKIISVFLARLNIPRKEIGEFTDRIERREFDMLFDSFEAYDVQETRRVSREEGSLGQLIMLVCKKVRKGYDALEIADMLEEDAGVVQRIYDIVVKYAPEYDGIKIVEDLKKEFGMSFDSFEVYDVRETRRVSKEEGRLEGLIMQIRKKIKKGYSVSEIADMLEEEPEVVQRIYDVIEKYVPGYDSIKIAKELMKEFDMLFDSFEAYDVQETRRVSREEGRLEEKVRFVHRKIKKGYSVSKIADMLEEDAGVVQRIYDIAMKYAPEYDVGKIVEKLMKD